MTDSNQTSNPTTVQNYTVMGVEYDGTTGQPVSGQDLDEAGEMSEEDKEFEKNLRNFIEDVSQDSRCHLVLICWDMVQESCYLRLTPNSVYIFMNKVTVK